MTAASTDTARVADAEHVDANIRRLRIHVPQVDLDDLRDRLVRTRWPEALPGPGWDDGVPLGYLRELVGYWLTSYDWREHETRLNELPQFLTTIDGLDLHFMHVRSPEPDALPLIVTHGWPGSIVEFTRIVGPLADPRAHGRDPRDAFHVVAPSIPGFAFSGKPREPGWDLDRITVAFATLMARLGYARFGAHGGDFGSLVSAELGRRYPDRLIGVHVNGFLGELPRDPAQLDALTADERERVATVKRWWRDRRGYAVVQATRPQTIAYALTDSPVGQLAWIVEKFREWTDTTNLPEEAVDRDQLLTNVTLYWLTATAGSSARLYKETADLGRANAPSSVPTGVAVFPREPASLAIRTLAEGSHNIVHWSEFDRGGHFPAMEVPDLLIGDLRAFFRRFR
jgi:pimeloyl-ACP methyl ester carboxylesterase